MTLRPEQALSVIKRQFRHLEKGVAAGWCSTPGRHTLLALGLAALMATQRGTCLPGAIAALNCGETSNTDRVSASDLCEALGAHHRVEFMAQSQSGRNRF